MPGLHALHNQPDSQGDFVKQDRKPHEVHYQSRNDAGDMERNTDQLRSNRNDSNPCEPTWDQSPAKKQVGKEKPANDEAEFAKDCVGPV